VRVQRHTIINSPRHNRDCSLVHPAHTANLAQLAAQKDRWVPRCDDVFMGELEVQSWVCGEV
ncbi:CheY-like superfamily, partial [Penicillium brevicompactum]